MEIRRENRPTRDEIIKTPDIRISEGDFSKDQRPGTDEAMINKDFVADLESSERPYKSRDEKAVEELIKIYTNGVVANLGDKYFQEYAADFCDGELRTQDVVKRIFGEQANFFELDSHQKEAIKRGFVIFYERHKEKYDLIAGNDYFLLRPKK
jgi:hypothetical protein